MKISLKLIFRKFVEFGCPALYLTSKKNSRKARQESEYNVHYRTNDSQETLNCLHQEDDTGLGVTWPSLSSHTKLHQVTQACQVCQLCCTWPRQDAVAKSAPRHPNSTDLANFRELAKTSKTSNVTSK
jgi:hypothetical protein